MEKTEFEVTLRFTTEMLGTVAKDPDVYKTYIESKKPEGITEEEYLTVEKIEEKGWTGFHKDENGLFIYDYMIRGFLKEAGGVLKEQVGVKNLRSKIEDVVFVSPRRIYLHKQAPENVLERPLRGMTRLGPRVALMRSDSVGEGTEISFKITIIKNKEITEKIIKSLWEYGEFCGLGQWRNGGYGTFKVVTE